MIHLEKVLAPKPMKRPFKTANSNRNAKISTAKLGYTRLSKIDLRLSQEVYQDTSSTLIDLETNFVTFESELEKEVFRSEINSILSQEEIKLPFVLCEHTRESIDVVRTSNPFFRNIELNTNEKELEDRLNYFRIKRENVNEDLEEM